MEELLFQAYYTLIASQFPGRDTTEGQLLLCHLREHIAEIRGIGEQEAQESAEWEAVALKNRSGYYRR